MSFSMAVTRHLVSRYNTLTTMMEGLTIKEMTIKDIRFPTSLNKDGSDAMHTDPDYSCAYVQLKTSSGITGHGLAFTLGRGTEVVISGIKALERLVIGSDVNEIFKNFNEFWRRLTSESQLRWIGPEKGVMHLATAAVINSLWDLWAKLENKPLWKLLVDMEPEQLVSTIDFRYITDVITRDEAVAMLRSGLNKKKEREAVMAAKGYPAYTTQVGWLGYDDKRVKELCQKYMEQGFKAFKIKVGQNLENDKHRCHLVRQEIGQEKTLMVDANQVWEVNEAINWMKELAQYRPLWIEEPTSPDDVLGHATIAKALKEDGIGVATGEMCCNRVMFKQLLQSKAIDYCQIDSCRLGGVNEILSVYLMANKLGVKVCPHAGGVGLCEMVQHLQIWDYICLTGSTQGRWIEYVDQQHEHFIDPVKISQAAYQLPQVPGYSSEMKQHVLEDYQYPNGKIWRQQKK